MGIAIPKTGKELLKAISVYLLLISLLEAHLLFAWYSRYTADDYSLMALIREKGIVQFPVWFYLNHEGCFSTWIYQALLCKSMLFFSKPFVFLLSFMALCLFCLYKSFHALLFRLTGKQDFINSLLFAVLTSSAFYMTTYGVNEAFYWCVGGVYLVFASLFIYALTTFILTDKKRHLAICIFAFFLFGMSRLNYAFIALSIFGLIFLYQLIRQKTFERKYLLAILVLAAGIGLYVVAPGNYVRRGGTSMPSVQALFSNTRDIFLHFFIIKLKKAPIYFVYLIPAYFAGQMFGAKLKTVYPDKSKLLFSQLRLGFLFICLVAVHSGIMVIANNANSHDRTIVLLDILFIIYTGNVLFHLGAFFTAPLPPHVLLPFFCLLASGLLLYRTFIYQNSGSMQALADDQRTARILSALAETHRQIPIDTLLLEPLPKCPLLYNWDLTKLKKNDAGWGGLNNGLMLYYQTPFKIDSGATSVRKHIPADKYDRK